MVRVLVRLAASNLYVANQIKVQDCEAPGQPDLRTDADTEVCAL